MTRSVLSRIESCTLCLTVRRTSRASYRTTSTMTIVINAIKKLPTRYLTSRELISRKASRKLIYFATSAGSDRVEKMPATLSMTFVKASVDTIKTAKMTPAMPSTQPRAYQDFGFVKTGSGGGTAAPVAAVPARLPEGSGGGTFATKPLGGVPGAGTGRTILSDSLVAAPHLGHRTFLPMASAGNRIGRRQFGHAASTDG